MDGGDIYFLMCEIYVTKITMKKHASCFDISLSTETVSNQMLESLTYVFFFFYTEPGKQLFFFINGSLMNANVVRTIS